MKFRNNIYFLLVLLILAIDVKAQQQFGITQYVDDVTSLNPTYSLVTGGGMVNMVGRKQWVGIDGAPTSFMMNAYLPIESIGSSAGLTFLSDKVAIENLNEINGFFAKQVKISSSDFLASSLNFGFRKYVANYSQLAPNDDQFLYSDVNETVGNIGFGVMVYNPEKYYVGVSMPRISFRELAKGSVEGSRNFRKYYNISLGYFLPLGSDFKMKTSMLVNYTRNVPVQADISFKAYLYDAVGVGMNYRSSNEVAGMVSTKLKRLRLGYSYLFGFGSTRIYRAANGTHEVSLGYSIKVAKNRTNDFYPIFW